MRPLSDETRGLWLGLLGVVLFAITLPMTRLAVGSAEHPQLDPVFVTAGRAAIAGLLSLAYLRWRYAPICANINDSGINPRVCERECALPAVHWMVWRNEDGQARIPARGLCVDR